MKSKKRRIVTVITVWLTVIVVFAYAVSAVLTYLTLRKRSEEQTLSLIKQNVEDVTNDISQVSELVVTVTAEQWVKESIPTSVDLEERINEEDFIAYCQRNEVEVNAVNKDGKIVVSSNLSQKGKNISEIDKFKDFSCLLSGEQKDFIKQLDFSEHDDSDYVLYGAHVFDDGSGFLMIGMNKKTFYEDFALQAQYSSTNRRIGEKGYLLVCDNDLTIINSYHNEHDGKKLSELGIEIDTEQEYSYNTDKIDVDGKPCYVTINEVGRNIYIVGVFPVKEAIASTKTMMFASILVELAIFAILFVTLFVLLRKLIVKNLVRVNSSLAAITSGKLDEKIEVRDTYEFNLLSDDINATVNKLKAYISEAEARIDADLAVAKAIQSSSLPTIFPPFPERKEFELFASMTPAKEVGGDFYDFYMLNNDTLGFLIADVSGKSIPGAMFMMTAKTIIKSLAESGLAPSDVFSLANKKLCESNDAEMFVTAWMGHLDLKTGIVHVVNAGHNPPVLIRNGKAEFTTIKPNLVLAGLDEIVYTEKTMQLEKGDILYLYTDGVTEAMNPQLEQYGNDRLQNFLSFGDNYPVPADGSVLAESVCRAVAKDVLTFATGAEQYDDVTMLCLRYLGSDDQPE